jgi:SAM-dependent methyltransferase
VTVDAPLDEANARFWDMLCGWSMAQAIGITGDEREDLARFDQAYLAYYPYLAPYFEDRLAGRRVLEVGLGFGTLGQLLAERGAEYHGVDIAAEPVSLMRRRLEMSGLGDPARVVQASALALPHDDASFDDVVSIGCLHHTGDLQRAINEVHRVLKPGGRATVMLYYRHSVRQLVQPLRAVVSKDWRRAFAERVSGLYDQDREGGSAPHTEYVSRRDARALFGRFASVQVEPRNFPEYMVRGRTIKRVWFLDNAARVIGLDLYIVARK